VADQVVDVEGKKIVKFRVHLKVTFGFEEMRPAGGSYSQ
jgi:hypothetical protein